MPERHRTPEDESRFHHYVGSSIPWFVHVGWILFWIFAVYYVLTYVIPTVRVELVTPP